MKKIITREIITRKVVTFEVPEELEILDQDIDLVAKKVDCDRKSIMTDNYTFYNAKKIRIAEEEISFDVCETTQILK